MKTMQGALASACAKRSRTRAAPTPTNISTNSEPLRLKNGTLRLAGDRARQQRLAGAGRADEQHALRECGRRGSCTSSGVFRNSTISLQLVLGLVDAGHVREPHLHVVVGVDLRAAARERHHAAFGAAHAAEEEAPERDEKQERDDPAEQLGQPAVGDLAGVLHAVLLELLDQLRILDADGREAAAGLRRSRLQRAADAICRATVTSATLPVAHQRLELAVRDRLAARQSREQRLRERRAAAGTPRHVPDGADAGAGRGGMPPIARAAAVPPAGRAFGRLICIVRPCTACHGPSRRWLNCRDSVRAVRVDRARVSPSRKSPSSTRIASGSSTRRWIVRFSGRAPYVGS